MTDYTVNAAAVSHARALIAAGKFVLDSEWSQSQPSTDDENGYLEDHTWVEYGQWFLGLVDGAHDETKSRYGFVYGDFHNLQRSGLVACVDRAAEWHHDEIEQAARRLLDEVNRAAL